MDIKNLANNVGAGRTSDMVKPQTKDTTQDHNVTGSGANTDRVTLTDVLSQVQFFESKTKEANIDNNERIAAIKTAISEGTYQVDAQRIAEKLIQTEALFNKV